MLITALLTWSMPLDCSWLAAAISAITDVTRVTAVSMSPSALPESSTSFEPSSTLTTLSLISDLISLAAVALRPASVAHFAGDDREAAALLPGPRRFDGRVQREQIGLERDLVDHADDVGDLLAGRR